MGRVHPTVMIMPHIGNAECVDPIGSWERPFARFRPGIFLAFDELQPRPDGADGI